MEEEISTLLAECRAIVERMGFSQQVFERHMAVMDRFNEVTNGMIRCSDYEGLERMTRALERVLEGA